MSDRPKLKFLMAVWGADYIEAFCDVSLASYLAPGNLPHLATETDLEILIMTSEASLPSFETQPLFHRLRALCPVRFCVIDDLIATGIYGVTLTLAFARGIHDSGAAQTDTTFLFMNADFVLAEGALATMLARLKAGQRCILAPSLRARSEAVLPILRDRIDPSTGTLAMPAREMVRLALDHLHATVIGKTVTQGLVTSSTHNQIYWQVDGDTLLVRHYLIFMLAIRPEVPLGTVNSYCDYGFVPEMVPSGAISVLDDSDDFLMLELQATAQERGFIRCGTTTPVQIAHELAGWTTAEHRRIAEMDIVYHAADLPAALPAARRGLAAFMTGVRATLDPRAPLNHVNHPYWIGGVETWCVRKGGRGNIALPAELATVAPTGRARLTPWGALGPLLRLGRRLLGTPSQQGLWRSNWANLRLGRTALKWASTAGKPRLLAGPSESFLLSQASLDGGTPPIDLDVLIAPPDGDDGRQFDDVLMHVPQAAVPKIRAAVTAAGRKLRPGGRIIVFVGNADMAPSTGDLSAALADHLDEVLPSAWLDWSIEARFVGGRWRSFLTLCERGLFRYMVPRRAVQIPGSLAAIAAWSGVGAFFVINNLRSRGGTVACPPGCTSALILFRRRGETAGP